MYKQKKLSALVLALAIALLTACGSQEQVNIPVATSSPEPESNGMVLAVTENLPWLKSAVSVYNESSGENHINVVQYASSSELLASIENDGIDMYFVLLDDTFTGDGAAQFFDVSTDLSGYLENSDVNLISGIESAFEYDGETRLLPFDFTLFSFASRLSELPSSLDTAKAIAVEEGLSIFPRARTKDNLTDWLLPFLMESYYEGNNIQFQAIADAVKEHEENMDSAADDYSDALFDICYIVNSAQLGIDRYELAYRSEGIDYVIGLPGASTAAFYVPHHVFGIIDGSANATSAWSFLQQLYTDELQSNADEFPASQPAFEKYISKLNENDSANEPLTARLSDLVENTTYAIPSMKLRSVFSDNEFLNELQQIKN